MNLKSYLLLLLVSMALISCDAVNQLRYSVRNDRSESIKVHIPNFPIEPNKGQFSARVDTIIEIRPKEELWIGTSPPDIDFPWATKRIYKKSPGICGIELVESESVIPLDCSKENWKYKKRWSTLEIE